MSNVCETCGKRPKSGNNVSYSKRRTKRWFLPNIFKKRFVSPETGGMVKKKICSSCLRTIKKKLLSLRG